MGYKVFSIKLGSFAHDYLDEKGKEKQAFWEICQMNLYHQLPSCAYRTKTTFIRVRE